MKLSLTAGPFTTPSLSTGAAVAALVLGPLIAWAIALEEWRIAVLLVLVAGVPALVQWPLVLPFGLYAFLVPFDAVGLVTSGGGATISKLAGLVTAVALIAVGLVQRRLVRPPMTAICYGAFILWALMSIGWSVEPATSIGRIAHSVNYLLMYVVAVSFRVSKKEFRVVIVATILGGLAAAVVPLVLGDTAVVGDTGRTSLSLQDRQADANKFAAGLLLPLLLLVGKYIGNHGIPAKALSIGAIAMIGGSIFLTASRSGLVAACLALAYVIWRSRRIGQGVIVAAIFVVLIGIWAETLVTRITVMVDGTETTGAGRTEIWKVGVQALREYWLWGSGWSTFPDVFRAYATVPAFEHSAGSHSIYIGTWVELGIVGLVLMLLTFALHFRSSFRCRRPSIDLISIEAACLAVMTAAAFLDHLHVKAFWLPFILLMWSVRLHTDNLKRIEAPSRNDAVHHARTWSESGSLGAGRS